MEIRHITVNTPDYPQRLLQLHNPPKELFVRGANINELLERPCVAIVGSRNVTSYGRRMTMELAGKLAEQGIVIISGLAIGLDALAHEACLEAGGLTIAVLPGPVEQIYPSSNERLGERLLAQGGVLVSEYPLEGYIGYKQNFIARNRIIAGLAKAILIPEAALKSGSLHTAGFGTEANRDIMAVPGHVTSATSVGTNNLIKSGAALITSYHDVLAALNLTEHRTTSVKAKGRNQYEQRILDLIMQGVYNGNDLQIQSELDIQAYNQVITMLQIGGQIRPLGANQWALR
jgi:DNA processing protein